MNEPAGTLRYRREINFQTGKNENPAEAGMTDFTKIDLRTVSQR